MAETEGEAEAEGEADVKSWIKLTETPSFDMLVLGCGGGPVEDNLSAYLVKPKHQPWEDGFLSVDGGEQDDFNAVKLDSCSLSTMILMFSLSNAQSLQRLLLGRVKAITRK